MNLIQEHRLLGHANDIPRILRRSTSWSSSCETPAKVLQLPLLANCEYQYCSGWNYAIFNDTHSRRADM